MLSYYDRPTNCLIEMYDDKDNLLKIIDQHKYLLPNNEKLRKPKIG